MPPSDRVPGALAATAVHLTAHANLAVSNRRTARTVDAIPILAEWPQTLASSTLTS